VFVFERKKKVDDIEEKVR